MTLHDKIDHTYLKPNGNLSIYNKLCKEAILHQFASVCVPPYYVKHCVNLVQNEYPVVCTVIGFPFGYNTTHSKLDEVEIAIEDGAEEIDIVINVSAVNDNDWNYVDNEIKVLTKFVKEKGKIIKVIFETAYLSDQEIIRLCNICISHQADFVKTSTGFADKGAEVRIIGLMKKTLNGQAKIKASGGIRDKATALEMIQAGADRLGASAGVKIISN